MSDNTPSNTPNEETILQGHNYDGITEYDNPMPGWWVGIFWITVIFSVLYVPAVHFFDLIDTYEEDLQQGLEEIAAVRATFEEQSPTFEADEATLATYLGDDTHIAAGNDIYQANCMACHGPQGQGLIGPNLTDKYWIYGNGNVDMFNVITDGVIEKGMTPWGSILSPDQRAQVIAFVRSLDGTNPPNPKEPQGELYE